MAKSVKFLDKDGNAYIFPKLIQWGRDDDISSLDMNAWARNICMMTELEMEHFEFDPDHLPHVKGELGSRAFEHGAATCLIIAGPVFEEIRKENAEQTK